TRGGRSAPGGGNRRGADRDSATPRHGRAPPGRPRAGGVRRRFPGSRTGGRPLGLLAEIRRQRARGVCGAGHRRGTLGRAGADGGRFAGRPALVRPDGAFCSRRHRRSGRGRGGLGRPDRFRGGGGQHRLPRAV
ncbi:MAG: hypothetical protein AVDCRST_MAG89-3103, partial [uncultured Gemmatimonadetes bacterium]